VIAQARFGELGCRLSRETAAQGVSQAVDRLAGMPCRIAVFANTWLELQISVVHFAGQFFGRSVEM
jgi:hypothetical protein